MFIQTEPDSGDLLAGAVAREQHGILRHVREKRGCGAAVESAQPVLTVAVQAAVKEATVHTRECLHLHFHRVERLAAQNARDTT